jgi:hypothetical protein
VAHFAFGEHNPVSLGLDPEQGKVAVFVDSRPVPPLADQREEVGR